MNLNLEEFFKKDGHAFYGDNKFRGVDYDGDTVRKGKALEQAGLSPVSFSKVFSYANDFLELIRVKNGCEGKIIRCACIELDKTQQVILDNGIIAKNLEWKYAEHNVTSKRYNDICAKFGLTTPRDIVWMKFTKKGYLGVVAKSFDINFEYEASSGKLVNHVNDEWDESFVFIFPLTPEILGNYKSGDLELAIGNYLISKGVPIIDYYSHNN